MNTHTPIDVIRGSQAIVMGLTLGTEAQAAASQPASHRSTRVENDL